jgi:outer membrane protein TolC
VKVLLILSFILTTNAYSSLISFEEALSEIVERNVELPKIEAELQLNETQYLSSKLSFLPSLSTSYQQRRSYEFDQRSRDLGLNAELNLFRGGSDFYRLRANRSGLQAQKHRLQSGALQLEKQATDVMMIFIEVSRRSSILRELEQINESSLKVIRERARRGLVPEQEIMKAEIDFQNAKAQRLSSLVELERARRNLIELLGHDNLSTNWPLINYASNVELANLDRFNFDLEDRPEYQALKYNLESSQARLRATKLTLLPRVDVSHRWSKFGAEKLEQNDRVALLTISFPLFEGYRPRTSIDQEWARRVNAEYDLRSLERKSRALYREVKENLLRLRETVQERERTQSLARKLFDDNFKRYQEGRTSVNELLIDQNRLFESQILANRGLHDFHQSLISFCQSQGLLLQPCLRQLSN